MKYYLSALMAIAAVAALAVPRKIAAQETEGYRIQITRKTENQRKGDARRMPFGPATTRPVAEAIFYRIEVRRTSPDAPETAIVEALLVVENPFGRLSPAGYSRETVTFPLGVNTALETDSIELERVEWKGPLGGKGTFGAQLYGYVVRLLDAEGKTLLVRSQPVSLRDDADKLIAEWKRRQEREQKNEPAAPRVRQPPWKS